MSKLANKDFKRIVTAMDAETLVKEGCKIAELIDDYKRKREYFEVVTQSKLQKPFDKNSVRIVAKEDTAAD